MQQRMIDPASLETNALFTQYLEIVNRALGERREDTPYRQLFAATEKALEDKRVGVAVYKDDAAQPHDYFTIEINDGTFDLVSQGKQQPDIDWKVKRSHLERVVAEPQPYIEQPLKLDLDWLKSRVGLA